MSEPPEERQGRRLQRLRHGSLRSQGLQPERTALRREESQLPSGGPSEVGRHPLASGRGKQHARGHGPHGRSAVCAPDACGTDQGSAERPEDRHPRAAFRHRAVSLHQQPAEALHRRARPSGDQLRHQQGGARQGGLLGLRPPGDGRGAGGLRIRDEARSLALRPEEGARTPEGSGLSAGLRDGAVVGLQQHDRPEGDSVHPAAAPSGRHPHDASQSGSRSARRAR